MDLVRAYKFLSDKRIELIKEIAENDQLLIKTEKELKKEKQKEKPLELWIEGCEKEIEWYKECDKEYRELLDVYFEASESIKAIIALKNHVKTKGYDLYWELEGILSPVLKEWVYGKE